MCLVEVSSCDSSSRHTRLSSSVSPTLFGSQLRHQRYPWIRPDCTCHWHLRRCTHGTALFATPKKIQQLENDAGMSKNVFQVGKNVGRNVSRYIWRHWTFSVEMSLSCCVYRSLKHLNICLPRFQMQKMLQKQNINIIFRWTMLMENKVLVHQPSPNKKTSTSLWWSGTWRENCPPQHEARLFELSAGRHTQMSLILRRGWEEYTCRCKDSGTIAAKARVK